MPYMPEKTDVYALGVLMVRVASLKEEFIGLDSITVSYPNLAEIANEML